MAQTSGKYELLGKLAPAIRDADGALVFTETVRAANHAINRLDPLVSIDVITGSTARAQRRDILDDLRVRKLERSRLHACSTKASTSPTPTSASS